MTEGAPPPSINGATKQTLRLFDWVSDAWHEIQLEMRDWKFMRRRSHALLLPQQAEYTPQALNMSSLYRWLPDTDNRRALIAPTADPASVSAMAQQDYDQATLHYSTQSQPGRPQRWAVTPTNNVIMFPPPDQQYVFSANYLTKPVRLKDDLDEPAFPEEFHLILVWRALMEVAAAEAAPEIYTRARVNYDTIRSALILDQGPVWRLKGRVLA